MLLHGNVCLICVLVLFVLFNLLFEHLPVEFVQALSHVIVEPLLQLLCPLLIVLSVGLHILNFVVLYDVGGSLVHSIQSLVVSLLICLCNKRVNFETSIKVSLVSDAPQQIPWCRATKMTKHQCI